LAGKRRKPSAPFRKKEDSKTSKWLADNINAYVVTTGMGFYDGRKICPSCTVTNVLK
jgi:hypothetical protein